MKTKISRLLTATKRCISMAEVRRYVSKGIVTLNDEVVPQDDVEIQDGDVIGVGRSIREVITQEVLDGLK